MVRIMVHSHFQVMGERFRVEEFLERCTLRDPDGKPTLNILESHLPIPEELKRSRVSRYAYHAWLLSSEDPEAIDFWRSSFAVSLPRFESEKQEWAWLREKEPDLDANMEILREFHNRFGAVAWCPWMLKTYGTIRGDRGALSRWEDDDLVIEFGTPWAAPVRGLQLISIQWPDLTMRLSASSPVELANVALELREGTITRESKASEKEPFEGANWDFWNSLTHVPSTLVPATRPSPAAFPLPEPVRLYPKTPPSPPVPATQEAT